MRNNWVYRFLTAAAFGLSLGIGILSLFYGQEMIGLLCLIAGLINIPIYVYWEEE